MAGPNGIEFDGSTYLTRGADLTDNSDVKEFLLSFWMRTTDSEAVILNIGDVFQVYFELGNLEVFGTFSGTELFASTSTAVTDGDWHHVLISRSGTSFQWYIDDSAEGAASTNNDEVIDFTAAEHYIGWEGDDTDYRYTGDLAQIWFDIGTSLDLSVEANRRKFVAASAANSVDLGADGSTPTGSAPIIYLEGAASGWQTNLGTGGGFTENGTLADAATDPPEYAGGAITASGALASGAATVAGAASITGRVASGSLKAGTSVVSGEALRALFAAGVVQAQLASIVAAASREAKAQGTPQAQAATVDGTAKGDPQEASGALQSGPAAIEGEGTKFRVLTASGALQAGDGAIEGTAARTIKATGALAAQAASIVGAATIFVQGTATGALKAGASAIEGAAVRTVSAAGVLVSGGAAVSGAAELVHKASGALASGAASIAGVAVRTAKASGTLASQAAAIVGRMVINIIRPSFGLSAVMSDAPVALTATMSEEVALSSKMSDEPVALSTTIAP